MDNRVLLFVDMDLLIYIRRARGELVHFSSESLTGGDELQAIQLTLYLMQTELDQLWSILSHLVEWGSGLLFKLK